MGATRRRWVPLAEGLAVLVVALLALAALRFVTSAHRVTVAYWMVSERELGVSVIGGLGDTCYLARTIETPDQVQVVAECREPLVLLGRPSVGIPHEFEVNLQQQLGGRNVVDAYGTPARRCEIPGCGRAGLQGSRASGETTTARTPS